MTRIFVQRGSAGSSSNPARPLPTLPPQPTASQAASTSKEEEQGKDFLEVPGGPGEFIDYSGSSEDKSDKKEEALLESSQGVRITSQSEESTSKDNSFSDGAVDSASLMRQLGGLRVSERVDRDDVVGSSIGSSQIVTRGSYPPPPPVPPPKPAAVIAKPRRTGMGGSNSVRFGPARRPSAWSVVSTRSSPSGSCPSSPRSYGEGEGYNSADEQSPCFVSSYDDAERERLFELEIRRAKGFEVKRMAEDGNCLFRAVADQVYGDSESYDMVRQLSIDYMERERDHFSQFITEGFTSYCKRKRRDKVYGNNVEIQAFAEMYNRPIHIYCYSTEPINIFHGNYDTDTPAIRLSYHHGNHYNSLVDPRRLTIGAGLGFSSLQGRNIDREQVKAAIRAQQDQQIDNALLAEGRFYSDLELTEKEIERMVMEASRAEYLAEDKLKQQLAFRETSTSGAEPSSSSGTTSAEGRKEKIVQQQQQVLSSSMQLVLSMGFSYLQVMEAYGIFGDDVDSMVCYLLETGIGGGGASSPGRRKGKAAE